MKRHMIFRGLLLAALLAILGCATTGTGVTLKQDITDQQGFRANLVEKWDSFNISSCEYQGNYPAALLFDRKDDNKTLRVDKDWKTITSKQALADFVDKAKLWQVGGTTRVLTIIGPDGATWGYVATITGTDPIVSVVDERTINVSPPKDPRKV